MNFDTDIMNTGLEHVLRIAHERAEILEQLRSALLADDYGKIKFYASQLCGLNHDEYESCRIPESINTGAG